MNTYDLKQSIDDAMSLIGWQYQQNEVKEALFNLFIENHKKLIPDKRYELSIYPMPKGLSHFNEAIDEMEKNIKNLEAKHE